MTFGLLPHASADPAGRLPMPEQRKRFHSAYAMIYGHFRPRRHLMPAAQHCHARAEAFRVWREETCAQTVT